MPYRVKVPQLQLLHALSAHTDADGKVVGYDHESRSWYKDEIVPDDMVSPIVVQAYDAGDAHTLSVLERIEGDSQATPPAPQPKAEGVQEEQGRSGRRTRESQE